MRKWLLALLLLAARPAWADGEQRPWYGWQLLLADASAVALLAVPVSPQSTPLARGMGMTAFFMNGPIVHMAHRNPRSASLSLLRLPLLWLGRVAGGTAGQLLCSKTVECVHTAQLIGAGVGVMPVLLGDWIGAQPPPRSYYDVAVMDRVRLPRVAMEWATTLPLLAESF